MIEMIKTGLIIGYSNFYIMAADTSTIDPLFNFIASWVIKLGAIMAFVGGVMFANGWKSDDAEGKSRGLNFVVAGFMMVGIGLSPSIFGL